MCAYSWVKVGNFYLRSVVTRGLINNLFIIYRKDAGRRGFTRFVLVSVITKLDFVIKGTNRFVHTIICRVLDNLSMKRNSRTLIEHAIVKDLEQQGLKSHDAK